MSRATLTIRPELEHAPGATRYEVDCEHATTWLMALPGREPIPDAVFVRLAVAKHYDEERCSCTRQLRRRYGVTS